MIVRNALRPLLGRSSLEIFSFAEKRVSQGHPVSFYLIYIYLSITFAKPYPWGVTTTVFLTIV